MKNILRTLIVDDVPAAIRSLCTSLATYADVKIIGTCTSALAASEMILRERPSLVFLDVEMPGNTGIDLIRKLQPEIHADMCVVFYSAHTKYLTEMLRISAFDFLPKPYLPEELEAIIGRARAKLFTLGDKKLLTQPQRTQPDDHKFAFQTYSGLLVLQCSEVLLFRFTDNNCWQVMLSDRTVHNLRPHTTAAHLLNISRTFLQVRQDCIINIYYLTFIENQSLRCLFYPPYSDLEVIASRRFYARIREVIEVI